MGKNHHSATFPPSSKETYSWAQGFSELVCFVILLCFFYSPFIPKGNKGLHLCQQTLRLSGVSLGELFSSLIQWNPGHSVGSPLCFFPHNYGNAFLQVDVVALLSWVVFPKSITSSLTISCWVWERTPTGEYRFFHFPLSSLLRDRTSWLSLSYYFLAGTFFLTDGASQSWPIRLTRKKQLLWMSCQCDSRKGVSRLYLLHIYYIFHVSSIYYHVSLLSCQAFQ